MVAHGAQSFRSPSIIEKQFSPWITSDIATELCRCGLCVIPAGSEFMATVNVGKTFRLSSCLLDENIRAEPAISSPRPTL